MPLEENARCTVCIPTYNQSRYLIEAVKSVAEQTAPVRLIVSNDASPDDTAEVLAELQRQYRFEVVNHAVNRGISANLQWLLRRAQTPLVMRLDSDDRLHPEYVSELSALMDRYPKAGYAHCAIQEIDGEGRFLNERRLARSEEFQDADSTLKKLVYGYQVTANVLLFRRDALASVDFGAGSAKVDFVEDYDLSVRLADQGWGNVYSNRVLGYYRMWTGASRPLVGRKLKEIRGLHQIFSGSLAEAFQRRGWPDTPLRRRRIRLALANSDVLDRAEFAPGERESMAEALAALGQSPALRWALGEGALSRAMRKSVALNDTLQQAFKRRVKQVLFRR